MHANRERLLEAGKQVLLEDGPGATVGAIARRAGIADSSFFTYFASKEDLVSALMAAQLEASLEIAQRHARAPGPAIERLEAYIWEAAADLAPHRAYVETATALGMLDANGLRIAQAIDATLGRLVAEAQRDRTLRSDVTATDINTVVAIATHAAAPYLHARPTLWRRYVAFFIVGLRTQPPRPLPDVAFDSRDIFNLAAEARGA